MWASKGKTKTRPVIAGKRAAFHSCNPLSWKLQLAPITPSHMLKPLLQHSQFKWINDWSGTCLNFHCVLCPFKMFHKLTLQSSISCKNSAFCKYAAEKVGFFVQFQTHYTHQNGHVAAQGACQVCDLKNVIMGVHFKIHILISDYRYLKQEHFALNQRKRANLTSRTCIEQTGQTVSHQLTLCCAHWRSSVCF